MSYDPDKHHRRSIRLKGYDYTQAGAYFVTLCTWQRECLFGEIVGGKMQLNDCGRVLEEEWLHTAVVRPNVDLDAFVIMPNHMHGIIVICDNPVGASRRLAPTDTSRRLAPTDTSRRLAPTDTPRRLAPTDTPRRLAPTDTPRRLAPTGASPRIVAGSLGAMIGQIKSITTKRINALRHTPGQAVWQRNYHDHIIRSETALNNIRQYIAHNPMRWAEDEENPDQRPSQSV